MLSDEQKGHPMFTDKQVKRFWSKVKKTDACWLWTGTINHKYGAIRIAYRAWRAHRVAWVIANGNIPKGMNVLHRCDNPPCVNPKHLFLGSQRDNLIDCIRKGRNPYVLRTHCPVGHAYAGYNLMMQKNRRHCRACRLKRNRQYILRRRKELQP